MNPRNLLCRAAMVPCAVMLAAVATVGSAQSYPQRAVRLVLAYPPGGGSDTLARIVSPKLGENLGQQVVVENRPGAGANLGAEIAARSAPDGYTLFMGNEAHTINASLYGKLSYDLVKDFSPVTMLADTPNIVVVHPSVPAKSIKELIALAKARPGELNQASAGSGSSSHLAGELFKSQARIKMLHIPYKGGGPAVVNLVAGEASVGFATMPSVLPMIKAGRLRGLAVTTSRRSRAAAELPTVAESGLPDYEASTWYCLLVPMGVSRDIITRVHTEMIKVLGLPEVKERLASYGYEIITSTPEQLAAQIKSEIVKWAKVVKEAGMRVD